MRTLLLSADPAHSLADALGVTLGNDPVAVTAGLDAVHIDTQCRFEQAWLQVQRYVLGLIDRAGIDAVTAAEVTVVPGVDELLALLAVRDFADSGEYDALIVDCAATAETLRLLALPDALSWYLRAVLPAQRRVARGLRPLVAALGQSRAIPPDGLFEAVLVLDAQLRAVRELLDRSGSVRLVLTPESMVVAETRRTYTALALYGYRVDGVIVNRLVPAGRDAWRSAWAKTQAQSLTEVASSFAGMPMYRAAYGSEEPLGLAALRRLADQLYGDPREGEVDRDPLDSGPERELLTAVADGSEFELRLALPLAVRGTVQATRVGDELVVTVGGHRRLIALPSVLRRCQVISGRLDDGGRDQTQAQLRVRFRPDPALWPVTTAAAETNS